MKPNDFGLVACLHRDAARLRLKPPPRGLYIQGTDTLRCVLLTFPYVLFPAGLLWLAWFGLQLAGKEMGGVSAMSVVSIVFGVMAPVILIWIGPHLRLVFAAAWRRDARMALEPTVFFERRRALVWRVDVALDGKPVISAPWNWNRMCWRFAEEPEQHLELCVLPDALGGPLNTVATFQVHGEAREALRLWVNGYMASQPVTVDRWRTWTPPLGRATLSNSLRATLPVGPGFATWWVNHPRRMAAAHLILPLFLVTRGVLALMHLLCGAKRVRWPMPSGELEQVVGQPVIAVAAGVQPTQRNDGEAVCRTFGTLAWWAALLTPVVVCAATFGAAMAGLIDPFSYPLEPVVPYPLSVSALAAWGWLLWGSWMALLRRGWNDLDLESVILFTSGIMILMFWLTMGNSPLHYVNQIHRSEFTVVQSQLVSSYSVRKTFRRGMVAHEFWLVYNDWEQPGETRKSRSPWGYSDEQMAENPYVCAKVVTGWLGARFFTDTHICNAHGHPVVPSGGSLSYRQLPQPAPLEHPGEATSKP